MFIENTSKELKQETNLKGKKSNERYGGRSTSPAADFLGDCAVTTQTLRYPAHTPAISPARAGVGSEPLGSTTGRSPPPQGEAHHPGTALHGQGPRGF